MPDIFPAGVSSPGNNKFVVYTTVVAPLAPTLAELNAGTDISAYIPTAEFAIALDQSKDEDTRWSDVSTREVFGVPAFNVDELAHIVDPQTAGTVSGNLALGKVPANSSFYMAIRRGPLSTGAFVTAQLVDIFSVTTGASFIAPLPTGKYLRRVKISMTRTVENYACPAA